MPGAMRSSSRASRWMSWIKELSRHVRPKSKLAEAVGYAIRQEERLRVCLHRGDVPVHSVQDYPASRIREITPRVWRLAKGRPERAG
jgi:hypothetical protein